MNQLRTNPSSSSRRVTSPLVSKVAGSAGIVGSLAVPDGDGVSAPAAHGSTSGAGNPAVLAAAASPPLPNLQAAGFPAWWTNSSPMGSSER